MAQQQTGKRKTAALSFDATVDYYRELDLSPGATRQEVTSAYRARMKAVHPDTATGDRRPAATQEAARVNAAFSVLSKPDLRRAYDDARKTQVVQEQIMGRYATGLGGQDHYSMMRDQIAKEREPRRRQQDRSAMMSLLLVFVAITVATIAVLLIWAVTGSVMDALR